MLEIILVSQRLKLRLIESKDLQNIHDLQSLRETNEFNTLGVPENLKVTNALLKPWLKEYKNNKVENYVFVIENGNDEFIGLIALCLNQPKYKSGEVWYKLLPTFWGKGIATEALNRIIDFGFNELHLHRIEAGCAVAHKASISVLEKVGMQKEGRRRQTLPLADGWSDNYEYAILDSDFHS